MTTLTKHKHFRNISEISWVYSISELKQMNKITHAKGLVTKMMGLENIERNVVAGYKKIEDSVVAAYNKVENSCVDGYKKVEDGCVSRLFARENETLEEAKARLRKI